MIGIGMGTNYVPGRTGQLPPAGAVAYYDFISGDKSGLSSTFTRASAAWRFDETGVLVSTATDVLRVDYDGTTLAKRGVLLEVASTNGVRNSTGAGASAGVLPTYWTMTASSAGITSSVVGAGAEDGIAYVDLRFVGTAAGAAGFFINPDTTTQIVAATGETHVASWHHRLMAGVLTGVTVQISCAGYTAAGAGTEQGLATIVPTTAALKTQRASVAKTFAVGTTARMLPFAYVSALNGTIMDLTLRFALPQGEKRAVVSTVIPTTSAAITRAADVLTLTPFADGALTWRALYDGGTTGTIATGITGAYAVDPAALTLARVKTIWAATS